ncbi:hypothetical protein KFL_000560250 [Klebsormidium nitens]|uniref:Erythromycin esterase n=1 Tax=Klebsormidium nitens TaxID=105231 RepID=A0A1Y1HPI1_KLENI|nr:hypothetical protein KFL_000560250 [Klebsormidium nitens]|eukprot:GAQ80535.1 hypothetical protein KFL_000560250 [Klebsormidium nitens]
MGWQLISLYGMPKFHPPTLDVLQNAVVVKDAEVYYRNIYESYEDAWTIRDRHMFNSLEALKEHCEALCGGVCRAVVWAHNCHVSDARETEVAWEWHQANMGQLVKEKYGEQAVSIGFSTYSGTLTAASAWGEPGRCVRLKPPFPGTLEKILHEVSPTNFLLDCRWVEPRELCLWKRSIGLVYSEETQDRDNYYRAKVFKQHDKIIHIDQTRAVEPLDKESVWSRIEEADEQPQTYPFGI